MSRCVIQSKRRRREPPGSKNKPLIRISTNAYNAIADLADRTGLPMVEIATRLLDSALEDVLIEYPDDEVTDDA